MAIEDMIDATWTLTSTVAQLWFDSRVYAREYSFYIKASGTSSGVMSIQTSIAGSTATPITLGTAQTVDTGGAVLLQFTGPFALVRPYSSNMTGSIVVRLIGN